MRHRDMNAAQYEYCECCRFWNPWRGQAGADDDEERGDCRRHAPRPALGRKNAEEMFPNEVHWPNTDSMDWCGDFEPIP